MILDIDIQNIAIKRNLTAIDDGTGSIDNRTVQTGTETIERVRRRIQPGAVDLQRRSIRQETISGSVQGRCFPLGNFNDPA